MLNETVNASDEALLDLEGPINELARLTRTIAMVGDAVRADIEAVRQLHAQWEETTGPNLNFDLEVLFDHLHRASAEAKQLRESFQDAVSAKSARAATETSAHYHH